MRRTILFAMSVFLFRLGDWAYETGEFLRCKSGVHFTFSSDPDATHCVVCGEEINPS